MANALLCALPAVAAYVVLMGIASKRLCPERFEKAQKTLWIFVLFIGWLPRLLLGDPGAVELVAILVAIGFPVVSAYVVALLIQETREVSRSKS
jgi:hypothetical protein